MTEIECKRCKQKKIPSGFSAYKHASSGKVVKLKTCKDCLRKNKRGGCKPVIKEGISRECHCCKQTFLSASKFNILCEACREIESDDLYNVVL